jgi:branched-chain amino acid aminotransferase
MNNIKSESFTASSQWSAGAAYVDGGYVPVAEARLPLLDWGFLKSDVTYDVVGVWDGRFFRLDDHLERFFKSIERLRLTCPYTSEEVADILHQCVGLAQLRNAYVEMIATRGLAPAGSRDPRQCRSRFYAFATPYVWIVPPEKQQRGLHVVIGTPQRIPPESLDPRIKNFHWGDLIKGLFEAFDQGADTTILLDRDRNVTEGPGFNVFALVAGELVTPLGGVLEGITRKVVIELAESIGLSVRLRPLAADELVAAEEIFITSTAGGIMPVSRLDGRPVGSGRPGPLTLEIKSLYWAAHQDPRHTTPVKLAPAEDRTDVH